MTAHQVLRRLLDGDLPPLGGVCAEVDPELFFPEKGGSTRPAKRICLGCPVRLACLEWALRNREQFGVLGGLSQQERHKVLVSRKRHG